MSPAQPRLATTTAPGRSGRWPSAAATQSFGSWESGSSRVRKAQAHVEPAVAPVAAGAPAASGVALRTSAFATSAAVQSRCVAQTIAAAPVTSGAANDVPLGVTAVSLRRRPRGREHPDALPPVRRDRPASPASTPSRPASTSRARARRRRARRALRPGRSLPADPPPLPTAATTSAPESCSARSESTSARDELSFAEMLTTCAPCLRSQPSAASEAVLERAWLHAFDLTMRADSSVASGTMPTTPSSERLATRMLATAVPWPRGRAASPCRRS